MTEYDHEPIPGLPGVPPPGERIVWQGAPDWRVLARTAFHTRLVAAYFALLAGWAATSALASGTRGPAAVAGPAMTVLVGVAGVTLLHLLAFASARTTRYTLTNRRIVLRIGIALPKCINLPLGCIGSVGLATHADGSGDLPLTLTGERRLGYAALWPHARPWHVMAPRPMLRAVPDADRVAALIGRFCLAAQPGGVVAMPASATVVAPTGLDVALAA